MFLLYILLIKENKFSPSALQSYVALIYIILLAVFITAVELRTLRHAHLIMIAFFLMFPVGRGFALIFMGALLLGALVWGWVVGGVLIAMGILNIVLGITSHRREHHDTAELE